MTDKRLKARNTAMLREVYLRLRPPVRRILQGMMRSGWRPRIQQAWRSPAQQRQNLKKKTSKVAWSFHNATDRTGKPEALAVDVIDDKKLYRPPKLFWFHLARLAQKNGMETGIAWGVKGKAKREEIQKAIDFFIVGIDFFIVDPKVFAKLTKKIRIGWDPGHCQPAGVKLSAARKGWRP